MTPRFLCRLSASSGFTFTEVTIVMVLAGVVTLGLVTFYLNSQIMWTDASTQVLAQRDATALFELMRHDAQEAAKAEVVPVSGDSLNHLVIFYDRKNIETHRFFFEPADSFVHYGDSTSTDQGPVVPTKVERFHLSADPALGMVSIDTLRMRSTSGQRVTLSTAIGLYNQ